MKKLIFTILALLASGAALAQPACWPSPVRGTGSTFYSHVNLTAFAVLWYCPGADGRWVSDGFIGNWAQTPSDWQEKLTTLINGTDAERAAAWDASISPPNTVDDSAGIALMAELELAHKDQYGMVPVQKVDSPVAYKLRQSLDSYEFVPYGSIPSGTLCSAALSIGEFRVVPRSAATKASFFDTYPLITFAKCKPQ